MVILMLLSEARQAGLMVFPEGDRLRIRGPKIAEPLARALLERKAEVMRALQGDATNGTTPHSPPLAPAPVSPDGARGSVPARQFVWPAATSGPPPTWQGIDGELVDWFRSGLRDERFSQRPFFSGPCAYVFNPEQYLRRLEKDVLTGPNGPRAMYGALQDDIRRLMEFFSGHETNV